MVRPPIPGCQRRAWGASTEALPLPEAIRYAVPDALESGVPDPGHGHVGGRGRAVEPLGKRPRGGSIVSGNLFGHRTVRGSPAPDGLQIVGRILDYESPSVVTSDGEYRNLTVAPPNNYQFQNLTFHILVHELKAEEEVMNFPAALPSQLSI